LLLKTAALLELGTNIQRQPDFAAGSRLPKPVELHFDPQSAGGGCETALPFVAGDARQVHMTAGGSLWFKVELPQAHGLRLSTRGSRLDAALSVWKDCRLSQQAALAHGDDNFGLQAEVALAKSDQSFWMVRLDNLSSVSGQATLSAVHAAVVQGTVLRDSGSVPVNSVIVAVFDAGTSSPAFFTSTQTNSNGSYSIAVNGPITLALRTGNFGSYSDVLHQAFDNRACSSAYLYNLTSCGTPGDNFTPIVLTEPDTRIINFRLLTAPTLSGRVTSDEDGLPIRNASILVYSLQGGFITNANTDASGRYNLSGLTPQSVFVSAGSADHHTEIHDNIRCESSFCSIAGATALPLTGNSSTRVDFQLTRVQVLDVELTVDGAAPPANFNGTAYLLNSNGAVIYSASVYGGLVRFAGMTPGAYHLKVVSNSTYPELYQDIECGSDCFAEIGLSTPVVVLPEVISTNTSMDLRGYAKLQGTITDEATGLPVGNAYVTLIQTNGFTMSQVTGNSGNYTFPSVATGSYFLHASAQGRVDELHENIPCESANPVLNCPGGLLLNFPPTGADRIVDFQLTAAASITGVIQAGGFFGDVYLLSTDGQVIRQQFVSTSGDNRYTINDVPPGTYLIGAKSNNWIPQIYPSVDCAAAASGNWENCNLSAAQAIVVENSAVSGIDFNPSLSGSRRFRVVSAYTNLPLQGISLDLWRSDFTRAATFITDTEGQANVGLSSYFNGTEQLFITTDNALGLVDQVYENISCPNGSVFFGACSLAGGTLLSFPAQDSTTPVLISLSDPRFVFSDGFEQ
jgi:hypothetical protein